MATKYSLTSIPAIGDRKVFFDANVLIYIFWPSGAYHWESFYSSAFGSLLRQRNELMVDFIVISEIINLAHRLEYEKYLSANGILRNTLSYKQYRNSSDVLFFQGGYVLFGQNQASPNDNHAIVIGNGFSECHAG